MSTDAARPLDSPEVGLKLFVSEPDGVRMKELIPVFHRWIKEDLLDNELQIDVASYEHVPKGPGIVLICDKAHYYFEVRHGRPGMRYRGRREARETGGAAVTRAFYSALRAARLLETDPALGGRYRFRTDEVEFGITDRLFAPSGADTLAAIASDLETVIRELYGTDDVELELLSGPKEPFLVRVSVGVSPGVEDLLGRLTAARA